MPDDKNKLSDRQLIEKLNKDIQTLLPMQSKMNEILEHVKAQNKKIEQLERQLNAQKDENSLLNKNLGNARDEINDLQQRSRLNNIIINGIPEARGEDVTKLVENLGDKMKIPNAASHIQVAHRVKSMNESKTKPIVVRLLNTKTRDIWTKAFREQKLWHQKIYVNEHLTKRNQDLHRMTKAMKEKYQYKYVWVRDCKIFVRKNETARVYVVRNEKDLERIFGKQEESPEINLENSNF